MGSTGFVRSIRAKTAGALAVVCSLAGLIAAAPASAGTLDQQQTDSDSEIALFESQSVAQTFTPDISGGLDQVDLELLESGTPPAPVTVEIRTAPGGSPGPAILATASVPLSAIEETLAFVPVTFATPASVTAGVQYAIVAHSPGTPTEGSVAWGFAFQNPYEAGQMFLSDEFPPAGTWNGAIFESEDTAFKTYVAPPQPPPPATATCKGTTIATINGTDGDDNFVGTVNGDAIFGLGGNDELDGVDGNDCLDGGEGDDRASGGADDDLVKGRDGRDKVRGLGGKDRLKGQSGEDRLNGGEGSDKLSGGPGPDKLRGGAAKDKYKGNAGDDDLNAVDAKRDRVNCGAGDDKAVVDAVDRVSANCETVREVEKDD